MILAMIITSLQKYKRNTKICKKYFETSAKLLLMILDKTENINNDNTYELAVGKHVHVIQTVF